MSAAPLHIGGQRLMLDPSGVLAWPAEKLLCVADLHLEKGSAFAAAGRFLPPYDTRETLERLARAVKLWSPQRLVMLGDSFHDARGESRLAPADLAALLKLLAGREVTWVLGNHDPVAPASLPGEAVAELRRAPFVFRHIAQPGTVVGEISGHFHPKAAAPVRGGAVTRPCFLTDGRRVLLPAFGAFTGGLDIRDPAIAAFFPRGGRAFLLGEARLYSFPTGPLRRIAPSAAVGITG
jgi:DNA ligase-associated metallophosphoesterase